MVSRRSSTRGPSLRGRGRHPGYPCVLCSAAQRSQTRGPSLRGRGRGLPRVPVYEAIAIYRAFSTRTTTAATHAPHMTSASKHARFYCTADGRRTRKSSRERGLQQWKGHALSVREQCMGKGRVRASASGWRTFRRVVDVLPEGRPIWESNPATSAGSRGGTPVLGQDNGLPRVPLHGLPLA